MHIYTWTWAEVSWSSRDQRVHPDLHVCVCEDLYKTDWDCDSIWPFTIIIHCEFALLSSIVIMFLLTLIFIVLIVFVVLNTSLSRDSQDAVSSHASHLRSMDPISRSGVDLLQKEEATTGASRASNWDRWPTHLDFSCFPGRQASPFQRLWWHPCWQPDKADAGDRTSTGAWCYLVFKRTWCSNTLKDGQKVQFRFGMIMVQSIHGVAWGSFRPGNVPGRTLVCVVAVNYGVLFSLLPHVQDMWWDKSHLVYFVHVCRFWCSYQA